ncbi:MAG TPA: (2Fe-2S)-binding protein [Thermoanaerobaculia bacterium]|nr:(2Fe-2S)-binding protein [Thermoanaerobaculia bacterium]
MRLSLRIESEKGTPNVIVCICRGARDKDVMEAIDNGASSVRDLQRCGIGDQCGSCHTMLRTMLARAAAAAPVATALPEAACACQLATA